jgi:hypothetical protein
MACPFGSHCSIFGVFFLMANLDIEDNIILALYEREEDFNLVKNFCSQNNLVIPRFMIYIHNLIFKKTIINYDIPPIYSHTFIKKRDELYKNWKVLEEYTDEERDRNKRQVRYLWCDPYFGTTNMYFTISIGDKNDRHSKWWKSVIILTDLETGYRYYIGKNVLNKLLQIEPKITLFQDVAKLCQLYPQRN